ncbi:MAG: type II secretion system secretin GspD [Gammaproteobacteria bacterium]|nr:type II secretion system secretin GspD [Gammaproteobacteria bacterium]
MKKLYSIPYCLILLAFFSGMAYPAEPLITLNFINADIETVARTLAQATKRNLIIDPKIKGNITLNSEKPVPTHIAWDHFLSTLRTYSFAMVESNGLYKIVPEAEAKLHGGQVLTQISQPNGQLITQIFRIHFESSANLLAVLRPLISPNNIVTNVPTSNILIVTDYDENIRRISKIIEALDVPKKNEIEVIGLKYANASEIAVTLQKLLFQLPSSSTNSNSGPGAPNNNLTPSSIQIIPELNTNSLIVRAQDPLQLVEIKGLIAKLDHSVGQNENLNIRVIPLKHSDATKLAATLRTIFSKSGGSTGVPITSSVASSSPQPTSANNEGNIQADIATNSLLIYSSLPTFRQIKETVEALDKRRPQVLVESLIVEVNESKLAQFGIQWQDLIGSINANRIGVIGTNFSNNNNNLISLAAQVGTSSSGSAVALPTNGLNIAVGQKIGGKWTISALASFLQNQGGSNILSTPTLLTLDNEEAKIVVGQNIPILTGQFTVNTGTANPFQTISRQDVGLTLKIKPQSNDEGTVRLNILQEVSSIDKNTTSSAGIITNKRTIESNVLVEDGHFVVLGGLLSDEYSDSNAQVPGLGNLPILGALFKNENRNRTKQNLMVFLKPTILRNPSDVQDALEQKYNLFRDTQLSQEKSASTLLPISNDLILPKLDK